MGSPDVICAECGAKMVLRESKYGKFYGCSRYPFCKGAHGAHADGRPLGVPADQETKQLRIIAHGQFDRLWSGEGATVSRREAYVYLSKIMELPESEAHIGRFTKEQCNKLLECLRGVPA